MTESSKKVPKWIQQEIDDKASKQRAEQAENERLANNARTVADGGPAFWEQFTAQVKVNTDALQHLNEHLAGSASISSGSMTGPELSCIIQVNRHTFNPFPALSRMNLFHQPRGAAIRRNYQGDHQRGNMKTITLHARDN